MGEILPRIWDFTCGFEILLVEFQETEFLEFLEVLEFLEFLEFRRRDSKFWQRNLESFESFNSPRKAKFKLYAVSIRIRTLARRILQLIVCSHFCLDNLRRL